MSEHSICIMTRCFCLSVDLLVLSFSQHLLTTSSQVLSARQKECEQENSASSSRYCQIKTRKRCESSTRKADVLTRNIFLRYRKTVLVRFRKSRGSTPSAAGRTAKMRVNSTWTSWTLHFPWFSNENIIAICDVLSH